MQTSVDTNDETTPFFWVATSDDTHTRSEQKQTFMFSKQLTNQHFKLFLAGGKKNYVVFQMHIIILTW
jgi:hypothetical protein